MERAAHEQHAEHGHEGHGQHGRAEHGEGLGEGEWVEQFALLAGQGEHRDEGHRVAVTLEDASGTSQVTCDYFVGADGGRSRTRKEIGATMVGTSFKEQSWLVLERIRQLAIEHGGSMNDVVKLVQYFRDLRHYPFYNRVRGLFYPVAPPVSTVVEVSRFMPGDGALVEVEGTMYLPR